MANEYLSLSLMLSSISYRFYQVREHKDQVKYNQKAEKSLEAVSYIKLGHSIWNKICEQHQMVAQYQNDEFIKQLQPMRFI